VLNLFARPFPIRVNYLKEGKKTEKKKKRFARRTVMGKFLEGLKDKQHLRPISALDYLCLRK
jgi:hypothetical protein